MRPPPPIFTYKLGHSLYVPFTCRCNSLTLPETRGPNFLLPPNVVASLLRVRDAECSAEQWSHWCMYLDGVDTAQQLPAPSLEPIIEYPTATIAADTKPQTKVLLQEIQDQVQREDINFDSIVISGEGEPTLRLDDILELTKKVTETLSTQPLPPLRVTTNGLVPSDDTSQKLKRSGVSQVSVALMTSDKEQYETLMKPLIPDGHSAVCRFIKQSLESGLEVEVTAVDRQEIDKTKVEKLAKRLGVTSAVRWRTYFR